MAHPRLILRAAARHREGVAPLPAQDLTIPALDWVEDGMAPAAVEPGDVLPWLTHEARVAALGGGLLLDDPRPAFQRFFSRVLAEGGASRLRDHVLALGDARRLASEAARVRDDVERARHRPAARGDTLFEPFSSRRFDGPTALLASMGDADDPPPYAFGPERATWPGLTAAEVAEHLAEEGPPDAEGLVRASLSGYGAALASVSDVGALGSYLAAAAAGRRVEPPELFVRRWNDRQRVPGTVPDRSTVVWIVPGADREACLGWCRRQVSLHGGAIAALRDSWPPRVRD